MRRLVVPALLVVLLAVQAASLVPAYQRSKLSVVSVNYRMPNSLYASVLEPPELRELLDRAIASQKARMSDIEPTFSVGDSRLTVRFALESGHPHDVADAFARQVSDEAVRQVRQKIAAVVMLDCGRPVQAPGATTMTRPPPPVSVVGIEEGRLPWLRPVDVLAALAYLGTLLYWLKGRDAAPRPPAA